MDDGQVSPEVRAFLAWVDIQLAELRRSSATPETSGAVQAFESVRAYFVAVVHEGCP